MTRTGSSPVAAVYDRRLRSAILLGAALVLSAVARAADPAPAPATEPAASVAPAAAAAPADNSVIYPRGTTGAGAVPEKTGSSFGPTTALAIVMLAGAGAWMLWRSRRDGGISVSRAERKLAIAETRSLGNRQYLVVATYEDKKFLLGVCPGRVDLLTALESEKSSKET